MTMTRRHWTTLFVLTGIHLVAALAALLWSFKVSSDVLEGRPVSWLGRHVAGRLTDFLWFPVRPAVEALQHQGFWLPPVLQWAVLTANSGLWAIALLAAWSLLRRRDTPPLDDSRR